MTSEQLAACSKKKLEALAKNENIPGWKTMRKEQLVTALLRAQKSSSKANGIANAKQQKVSSVFFPFYGDIY